MLTFINPLPIKKSALQILLVACVWIIFYYVSVHVMAFFSYNDKTFWVFLPAGVRLVAVILFNWLGVVGLFIGSVLTPDDVPFRDVLLLSAVSALTPKLALSTGRRLMNLCPEFVSLKPIHLLMLALMASSYNAVMRVWLINHLDNSQPMLNLLPMFVGDLVGTFIIFYLSVLCLWLAQRWLRPLP